MSRTYRIILLSLGGIMLLLMVGIAVRTWQKRHTPTPPSSTISSAKKAEQAVLAALDQKLLFTTQQTIRHQLTTQLHLETANAALPTATFDTQADPIYSNFLGTAEQKTWFSVQNNQLLLHTLQYADTPKTMGALQYPVLLSPQVAQSSLAVNSAAKNLAWVTGTSTSQQIVVEDLTTRTQQVVFGNDQNSTFTNLAWSPDGNNLAFTDNTSTIHIIDKDGKAVSSTISIASTQFNYLAWIEPDHLATVASSSPTNPKPFAPQIIIFKWTDGTVIERHSLDNNIGVPKVIWSPDGLNFMYYHPWENALVIFNRFDQLQAALPLTTPAASGSTVAAFGWTVGTALPPLPSSIANATVPKTTNTNNANTNTAPAFSITPAQWDQYNTTVRAILNQFPVDFTTYRFVTTPTGLDITATLQTSADKPELLFLQTILQILFALDKVPSVSVHFTYGNNQTLTVTNITRATVKTLLTDFTTVTLDQLFTQTNSNTIGSPTIKTDTATYTYLGDLVYANSGYYNPLPALALLGGQKNTTPLLWNTTYALAYPAVWQHKVINDHQLLFYTSATTFMSNTAWQGFSVSIQDAPNDPTTSPTTWLQTHKPGVTATTSPLTVLGATTVQQITSNDHSQMEYLIFSPTAVYDVTVEQPPTISDTTQQQVQDLVSSLSIISDFKPN